MKEFRYIGDQANELDGGTPVGRGDYTGPIKEDAPGNVSLIEAGLLIEVPSGTKKKVDAANEAARSQPEENDSPKVESKEGDNR